MKYIHLWQFHPGYAVWGDFCVTVTCAVAGTDEFGSEVSLILGYSGKIQIELVKTSSLKQTMFTEHIDLIGEGLHHLGFYVRNF